ncbi:MAG TPA: cyclic nucleotide-binding domain-containing protein [Candidatus Methylacidiphilales bacterium]
MHELSAVGIFGNLKEDDRDLLASYGEFQPLQPGGVLIEEGQLQPHLYCVLSGELRVVRFNDSGAYAIATLYPGDSIGEMAIFDLSPASATVQATQHTNVWRIAYEQLMSFVSDNPSSGVQILTSLLITLSRRMKQIDPMTSSVAQKIG